MLLHLLFRLRRVKITSLGVFFYNIFLLFYKTGIRIAAMGNSKARLWLKGRKNQFARLAAEFKSGNSQAVWVHCSSLGEFEQGRPVIEKIKQAYPHVNILLTFFSPSGYEIRKDYKGADGVFYLPLDSPGNAKKFLDTINPSLVVFIKYDYWYYYLAECKKRNIPLLMVSAIFRKDQPFFKWYGGLHRKMLRCVTHFFVQDENSEQLLETLAVNNVTIAGDTRFDRVAEIAENFQPIDGIEKFCSGSPVLVAGSTWPDDEKILKEATIGLKEIKLIIAPHEIHKEHIVQLKLIFPQSILFSELQAANQQAVTSNQLIIDNIGMLSRLYHYAAITYIGGGFNKGIHNTLEAAVHGKPVLFGPNYKKFKEAEDLIIKGGAEPVNSSAELSARIKKLLNEKEVMEKSGKAAGEFVRENRGATGKVLDYIQENRLLTS